MAGLPGHGLAVHRDALFRHILLRRPVVPSALLDQVQPVVHHDVRLKLPRHRQQLLALPLLPALAEPRPRLPLLIPLRIAEVVPHDVDRAVFSEQLPHLAVQILGVLLLVPALVELVLVRVVALGVHVVDQEIGVVPVDERVVQSHLQAAGAEGVEQRTQEITPGGRLGGLVVGQLGVPEAEPLVVLAGDDHVLHPRGRRPLGPLLGVIQIRIETPEVPLVPGVIHLLDVLDPLVPRRQGVQPPVNEHPEAVVEKPLYPVRSLLHGSAALRGVRC